MTIYSADNPVLNLPEIGDAAKAYEKYVNGHGGINGHPLKVTACNDRNDAAAAQKCARDAVSSNAVAVIGSLTQGSAQVIPILEKAGITWLNGSGATPAEFTSPVSYLLGGGPLGFFAGGYAAAKKLGCTSIGLVTLDVAAVAALVPFFQQGVTKGGGKFGSVVKIPPTSTDYSSSVTASKKDDCAAVYLPAEAAQAYIAKALALGAKQKYWFPQATFTSAFLKNVGADVEGAYTISPFVGPEDPLWDSAKQAAPDAVDEAQGQVTWASYVVFDAIASKINGAVDAKTFKAAADKATDVDTGGLYPPLDLTKPFPVPSFARIVDAKFVDLKVEGGKLVQDGDFLDYGPLFVSK